MRKEHNSRFVYKLARVGATSIGVVYALIGVIAILSLLRLRYGGASKSSVLDLMENIPMGSVLVALIFLGLISYVIWKLYNALEDPYGYGKNMVGIGKRLGVAAAGLAYGAIAYSALQALLNMTNGTHGRPDDKRQMVATIFQWQAGEWIVGALGALVALTGFAQFIYVIKQGYLEKLNVARISQTKKRVIAVLAWIGHFARGIILLIIAFFLVKASLLSNPHEVVNTDKAFDFLGDQIGKASFMAVALGTICYGFYMFALSRYYDFQDDF